MTLYMHVPALVHRMVKNHRRESIDMPIILYSFWIIQKCARHCLNIDISIVRGRNLKRKKNDISVSKIRLLNSGLLKSEVSPLQQA